MVFETVLPGVTGPVREYLTGLIVFIISFVILYIIKNIVLVKLDKLSAKTKTKLDDTIIKALEDIGWPFYFVLGLFIAIQFIVFPDVIEKGLGFLALIVVTYYAIRTVTKGVDYFVKKDIEAKEKQGKTHEASVLNLTSKIVNATIWIIAVIFILSNLGFNISSLIAGLGIGGIAIALAVQNVLGDIFSSVSIYLDKPFEVGDFIIMGDDMGVVKKIGIKSTRLQTLHGEELVISNRELTNIRINNYKQMKKRRVSFTLGVTYSTSTAKLEKIPDIIKKLVNKIKIAEFGRVHFKEFGPYSLNFDVIYYITDPDYDTYMDVQQKVNLEIKRAFDKEKIEIAFPTQTLFLRK